MYEHKKQGDLLQDVPKHRDWDDLCCQAENKKRWRRLVQEVKIVKESRVHVSISSKAPSWAPQRYYNANGAKTIFDRRPNPPPALSPCSRAAKRYRDRDAHMQFFLAKSKRPRHNNNKKSKKLFDQPRPQSKKEKYAVLNAEHKAWTERYEEDKAQDVATMKMQSPTPPPPIPPDSSLSPFDCPPILGHSTQNHDALDHTILPPPSVHSYINHLDNITLNRAQLRDMSILAATATQTPTKPSDANEHTENNPLLVNNITCTTVNSSTTTTPTSCTTNNAMIDLKHKSHLMWRNKFKRKRPP